MVEIFKLRQEYLFVALSNKYSFFIKFKQLGDVWIFNSFEGCQHILAKHKVKISQIKKIIITDSSIKNISGLLGLLSTISLSTLTNNISIYAPKNLHKYIFLCRKYSQTNFRYILQVHTILDGLIVNKANCHLYALYLCNTFNIVDYLILLSELSGSFKSSNAIDYYIPFGPLYGDLKAGKNFILPDGSIVYSKNFIYGYYLGSKLVFASKFSLSTSISLLNDYNFIL